MRQDSAMLAGRSPPKRNAVSARFEYTRMTAQQFSDALEEIDLPAPAFSRIYGVRLEVVERWLKGEQDIPPWVFIALWLMREIPSGTAIARSAAANHIKLDRKYPKRGEYPYLELPDEEGT